MNLLPGLAVLFLIGVQHSQALVQADKEAKVQGGQRPGSEFVRRPQRLSFDDLREVDEGSPATKLTAVSSASSVAQILHPKDHIAVAATASLTTSSLRSTNMKLWMLHSWHDITLWHVMLFFIMLTGSGLAGFLAGYLQHLHQLKTGGIPKSRQHQMPTLEPQCHYIRDEISIESEEDAFLDASSDAGTTTASPRPEGARPRRQPEGVSDWHASLQSAQQREHHSDQKQSSDDMASISTDISHDRLPDTDDHTNLSTSSKTLSPRAQPVPRLPLDSLMMKEVTTSSD